MAAEIEEVGHDGHLRKALAFVAEALRDTAWEGDGRRVSLTELSACTERRGVEAMPRAGGIDWAVEIDGESLIVRGDRIGLDRSGLYALGVDTSLASFTALREAKGDDFDEDACVVAAPPPNAISARNAAAFLADARKRGWLTILPAMARFQPGSATEPTIGFTVLRTKPYREYLVNGKRPVKPIYDLMNLSEAEELVASGAIGRQDVNPGDVDLDENGKVSVRRRDLERAAETGSEVKKREGGLINQKLTGWFDAASSAAKSYFIDTKGTVVKISYDMGKRFDAEQVVLGGGLVSLSRYLKDLARDPKAFVMRGELIDSRITVDINRRKHSSGDMPAASFRERKRHWAMFDADGVKLPEGMDALARPEEAAKWYVENHLPKQFRDADFFVVPSSSAGVTSDGSRLFVHMFFATDRAVGQEELTALCEAEMIGRERTIDVAVFRTVQPHITARPILGDGVADLAAAIRDGVTVEGTSRVAKLVGVDFDALAKKVSEAKWAARMDAARLSPRLGGSTGAVDRESCFATMGDGRGLDGFHDPMLRGVARWVALKHGEIGADDAADLKQYLRGRIASAPKDPGKRDGNAYAVYMSDRYLDDLIDGAERMYAGRSDGGLEVVDELNLRADNACLSDDAVACREAVRAEVDRCSGGRRSPAWAAAQEASKSFCTDTVAAALRDELGMPPKDAISTAVRASVTVPDVQAARISALIDGAKSAEWNDPLSGRRKWDSAGNAVYPLSSYEGPVGCEYMGVVLVPREGAETRTARGVLTVDGADAVPTEAYGAGLWGVPAPGTATTLRVFDRPSAAAAWLAAAGFPENVSAVAYGGFVDDALIRWMVSRALTMQEKGLETVVVDAEGRHADELRRAFSDVGLSVSRAEDVSAPSSDPVREIADEDDDCFDFEIPVSEGKNKLR